MTDKKHTIDDLFSDGGAFDEAEVVRAIHPFITIQKNTNDIFFKDNALSCDNKILAYGLAKKLLKLKEFIETEMFTAAELHIKTGIKKGTIDPTFKKLREKGFIVGKGEYEIPVYKITEVIKLINNK